MLTAPWLNDGDVRLYVGDALTVLKGLTDESVDACVSSPPYWGLRDYGHDGQIGLEESPAEYVARIVEVFREVRRVLTPTGTLWLNLGDSYAHGGPGSRDPERWPKQSRNDHIPTHAKRALATAKQKDLIGIPWRVAFALQDDGWWLRSDIIWHKPNPMPESVRDRPTSAHEHIFLLANRPDYYYDAQAIAEPATGQSAGNGFRRNHRLTYGRRGNDERWTPTSDVRNARNVWTIPPARFPGAHFAVMPDELARRCILAGSPVGRHSPRPVLRFRNHPPGRPQPRPSRHRNRTQRGICPSRRRAPRPAIPPRRRRMLTADHHRAALNRLLLNLHVAKTNWQGRFITPAEAASALDAITALDHAATRLLQRLHELEQDA